MFFGDEFDNLTEFDTKNKVSREKETFGCCSDMVRNHHIFVQRFHHMCRLQYLVPRGHVIDVSQQSRHILQ